jgi:hypothetical protein
LNDNGDMALHDALRLLRTPATIRARCAAIAAAVSGATRPLQHRSLAAARVAQRSPRGSRVSAFLISKIPYHTAGATSRPAVWPGKGRARMPKLAGRSTTATARARTTSRWISVLLDARRGPRTWRYREAASGKESGAPKLGRASFRAFMAGRFSSGIGDPYRVERPHCCA